MAGRDSFTDPFAASQDPLGLSPEDDLQPPTRERTCSRRLGEPWAPARERPCFRRLAKPWVPASLPFPGENKRGLLLPRGKHRSPSVRGAAPKAASRRRRAPAARDARPCERTRASVGEPIGAINGWTVRGKTLFPIHIASVPPSTYLTPPTWTIPYSSVRRCPRTLPPLLKCLFARELRKRFPRSRLR